MVPQNSVGNFQLSFLNSSGNATADCWDFGESYRLRLSNGESYKGFILAVTSTDQLSNSQFQGYVGTMSNLDSGLAPVAQCPGTPSVIGHTTARSSNPRNSDSVTWNAPANGTITEVFMQSIAVMPGQSWYGRLIKQIPWVRHSSALLIFHLFNLFV